MSPPDKLHTGRGKWATDADPRGLSPAGGSRTDQRNSGADQRGTTEAEVTYGSGVKRGRDQKRRSGCAEKIRRRRKEGGRKELSS